MGFHPTGWCSRGNDKIKRWVLFALGASKCSSLSLHSGEHTGWSCWAVTPCWGSGLAHAQWPGFREKVRQNLLCVLTWHSHCVCELRAAVLICTRLAQNQSKCNSSIDGEGILRNNDGAAREKVVNISINSNSKTQNGRNCNSFQVQPVI